MRDVLYSKSMLRRRLLAVVTAPLVATALAGGCTALDVDALGGGMKDGSLPEGAAEALEGGRDDRGGTSDAAPEADADPSTSCAGFPLDCLDPSAARVFEVPTEGTIAAALANAKTDDVVQVKGVAISSAIVVPDRVTLRGCGGAQITNAVTFGGSTGTVEGFVVSGHVLVDRTGDFEVKDNRFTGALPVDPLAGVDVVTPGAGAVVVTLLVEGNRFERRTKGVSVATSAGTGSRSVSITIRNNLAVQVAHPFVVAGSAAGKVTADVSFNTVAFGFDIALYGKTYESLTTRGNVFVSGTTAIETLGGEYDAPDSIAWQVTTPTFTEPTTGPLTVVDPKFVSVATEDFRLGAGSPAVDVVTTSPVPARDLSGCARPVGAKADIGALERRP